MTDLHRRRLVRILGAGLLAAPALARAEDDWGAAEPPPKPKPAVEPPAQAAAPPPPRAAPPTAGPAPAVAPEAALQRLMDGNARYAAGLASRPNADAARRVEVSTAQRPFAAVLACADSRTPPEIIFDQGLGDLFVIRVAGNVVDEAVIASVEYAVMHLGVGLVMVLGHERCGAVAAALDALAGRGDPADRETLIGALTALIAPAARAIPADAPDRLDAAVSLNAANAAAELFAGSRPLRAKVLAGRLKIVAARYDLDDGRVTPTKTTQG
jgi:carbonic anhydrase